MTITEKTTEYIAVTKQERLKKMPQKMPKEIKL